VGSKARLQGSLGDLPSVAKLPGGAVRTMPVCRRRNPTGSVLIGVAITATLAAIGTWLGERQKFTGMRCELTKTQKELSRLQGELRWLQHRAMHDLKNPLTPIVARAEMLRRSVNRPDEIRQVEAILRSAARMSRMIEDLAKRTALAQA
jgi:signal transduction histidine kinase